MCTSLYIFEVCDSSYPGNCISTFQKKNPRSKDFCSLIKLNSNVMNVWINI